MDHLEYCDAMAGEIERFAGLVRGADPSIPVLSCPGWTIAALIKHTGTIHRWAAAMVRDRAATRLDRRTLDLGLPSRETGYADWLAAGASPLTSALRDASPDQPMWAWGADQHARFWSRRMLLETTVHRADAGLALGRAPEIDAAVALDGIEELLENLPCAAYFAPKVNQLRGTGHSLHWHATDAEGEWLIVLGPEGYSWARGHGQATVAVQGPAASLLLLAYGRRRPDDEGLECFGDRSVLDRWLANSAL
jgi:uncharacterized protein (TIGR03083 family)